MQFPIVFTALTFMLITNFLYASIGGFNFLDQIKVGQQSKFIVSATCSQALGYYASARGTISINGQLACSPLAPCSQGTLDQVILGYVGNAIDTCGTGTACYAMKYCENEMKTYGLTASNFTMLTTSYSIDPLRIVTTQGNGTAGNWTDNAVSILNAVYYSLLALLSGISTFLSICFQVMVYSWSGPLGSVMAIINGLCITVTIVWVFKAISPTADA